MGKSEQLLIFRDILYVLLVSFFTGGFVFAVQGSTSYHGCFAGVRCRPAPPHYLSGRAIYTEKVSLFLLNLFILSRRTCRLTEIPGHPAAGCSVHLPQIVNLSCALWFRINNFFSSSSRSELKSLDCEPPAANATCTLSPSELCLTSITARARDVCILLTCLNLLGYTRVNAPSFDRVKLPWKIYFSASASANAKRLGIAAMPGHIYASSS
jgi:hypothetical protein